MQLREYFSLIKEIESLDKELFKGSLSEHLIITIIQEYCKDLRTNQIGEQKKTGSQIDLATEKQKNALKKLKISYPVNITKQEAFKIISEKYK